MLELAEVPDTLPPECQEVIRHIWDYLDGRLDAAFTERLRVHIAKCPPCLKYEEFQRSFLDLLGSLRARPSASRELEQQVLTALIAEGWTPQEL
jgi:anti-sigma factor (TIGR02949 family)